MITARGLARSLGLCVYILVSSASYAQVDPAWLVNWTEAQNIRPEKLMPNSRIGHADEPGIPMLIRGLVVSPSDEPIADIIVHAYHRDQEGFEFSQDTSALKTWKLQGWAQTDAEGRFSFKTIRPSADRLGREAAHVHYTLESKDYGRQWVPSTFLSDDPLVTDRIRLQSQANGKYGRVVKVIRDGDQQQINVSIKLKDKADF